MRNKRKEDKLKKEIIELRIEERDIKARLKQKFVDLYIMEGKTADQAARLV